jgi:N-acetylglucosamine kinase-like BadF-type ATPase
LTFIHTAPLIWAKFRYLRYGGAQTVAQEAIDAVLRADDGRGIPTTLTHIALDRLGYSSPEALLRSMVKGRIGREKTLSLCPLVFDAAFAGDKVAADIITKQGLALAGYATSAVRRFGMQNLDFDVVLSGSLFKGRGPLLIDTITQAIHYVTPRAQIVRTQLEPAVGGVLLAYDALGIMVTDVIYDKLAQTIPKPGFFDTIYGAGAS